MKYERGYGVFDLQINSKSIALLVQETLAFMWSDDQEITLNLAFVRIVARLRSEMLVIRQKRPKVFCLVPTAMISERGSMV